ncbi:MAG: Lrp/AsnC family transcriptional regulator [Dehalococcoidia bacterium]|nr:Lrp/AsnC family transcriptional regulator [Dehalococcoidia bacterium]
MNANTALDAIDLRILRELQQDARLTYSEIGRRVGLTPPAVTQRIRAMERDGVIQGYHAQVNPAAIGLAVTAFIRLATRDEFTARFAARVSQFPEVVECHRLTGEDSYLMKVVAPSIADLEALVDRLTPFGQTVTSIVLSTPVPHRAMEPPEATPPP